MADTSGVPGFSTLIHDYRGEPSALRWLSIHPDGRVAEHTSGNVIAWSVADELWVQAFLVRDVYREVDPTNRHGLTGARSIPTERGVVITLEGGEVPINPVVAGMLAELGAEEQAYGTVAWLGDRHPETGLHDDLDDDQRAALVELAVRCCAIPGGAS